MYNFAKLDLFMVKPYLKKYLLILIAISIPLIVSTNNVYMMSFIALVYGIMMISYPFVLSEKNNIENFYGTLSVNKKSIVNGRYIFALIIIALFVLISFACMIIGGIILKYNFDVDEVCFILSLELFMALILLSFQLPVFFKVGYTKGKLLSYMPLLITGMIVPLIMNLFDNAEESLKTVLTYIENNAVIASIILILVGLLIFVISNIVSQQFYLKKRI